MNYKGLYILFFNILFVNVLFSQTVITVGSSGDDFDNIEDAYNSIADATGGYIIKIQSDYDDSNETFPIVFTARTNASAVNNIIIRPADDVASVLEIDYSAGISSSAAVIQFSGADYVTIDGRPGGVGSNKYLKIIDSASPVTLAPGPCVSFASDATYNTIQYCILESESEGEEGIINFAGSSSTGNDNNSITYCNIGDLSSGGTTYEPDNLISTYGSSTTISTDNITISYCNLYDGWDQADDAYIYITNDNSNWTISNNSFYRTSAHDPGSDADEYSFIAFYSSDGGDFTITNNYFGGQSADCGGSAMSCTGGDLYGISANSNCVNLDNVEISNNTFKNITYNNSSDGSMYYVYWDDEGASGLDISDNTVQDLTWTATAANTFIFAVDVDNNWTFSGNTIGSTTNDNLSFDEATDHLYILYFEGASTCTSSNNTIQEIASSSSGNFYGMEATDASSGVINSTNDVFREIDVAGNFYAYYFNYVSGTVTQNITGAEITGITCSMASGTAFLYPINMYNQTSGTSTLNVKKCLISDIEMTGNATNYVRGIYVWANSSSSGNVNLNAWNNVILLDNGSNTSVNYYATGIYIYAGSSSSNTSTVYHNTISITGTTSSSDQVFGLRTSGDGINITARNNVFNVPRTTGGTIVYSIYIDNTGITKTFTNNCLNSPDAAKLVWYSSSYSLATWDALGANIGDNSITGTISLDAVGHVTTSSWSGQDAGYNLSATVSDDFAGDARDATPWMGAYESDGNNITAALCGNYYIGVTNDHYSGSKDATTLSQVISSLNNYGVSCAATIYLCDDSYTESTMTLNSISGASGTNTVTFLPYTGADPVIHIDLGADSESGLTLNGADYVTFDGWDQAGTANRDMTFEIDQYDGRVIHLDNNSDCDNISLKNCIIKGYAVDQNNIGFYAEGTDHSNLTIQNSYFYKMNLGISLSGVISGGNNEYADIIDNVVGYSDNGVNRVSGIGISVSQYKYVNVKNNEIRNMKGSLSAESVTGINLSIVDSLLCDSNNIHDFSNEASVFGISANTFASSVSMGYSISHNTITSLSASAASKDAEAMRLTSMQKTGLISQNVISEISCSNTLSSPKGIYVTTDLRNAKISRNEIYRIYNTNTTDNTESGKGIILSGLLSNDTIVNNQIYAIGGGGSDSYSDVNYLPYYPIGILINSTNITGLKLYYNSIYMTPDGKSDASQTAVGVFAGSTYSAAIGINSDQLEKIDMRNNIFYNLLRGSQPNEVNNCYAVMVHSTTNHFTESDYNIYKMGSRIEAALHCNNYDDIALINNVRKTLSEWQTYTGDDANSVEHNPDISCADGSVTSDVIIYTDIDDLQIPAGSGIDGEDVGISVDFAGTSRSNFTIGAYEAPCLAGLWTGTTSTDWNTTTNWDCGEIPTAATDVTIPDGCSNYPETFSGGTNPVCASLTIEDGADTPHLTLASGINLDCGGNITIEGTLTVASDASINCGGNWDASSGSFFSNQCTVTFDGTTILNSGGSSPGRDFYNIVIAGDVTLSSDPILAQNDITLSSGTLDVSAGNEDVFIGGDWNNTGGSFNPRAGQVMFNGTGTQHVNTTDGGTTVNTSNFTFYDVRIYGTDVRFHVKESDYKTISINDVQIDASKTLKIVKY